MAESEIPIANLAGLIRKMRHTIVWKPGSASRHLLKRKLRGHLPADASIETYEQLIQRVLHAPDASIFIYEFGENRFLTLMYNIDGDVWLLIASLEGIMETAFVVENPDK
jgi:hypothetical protein